MLDLILGGKTFADTTATITANTDAGKDFIAEWFGAGAVGVELSKSKAIEVCETAEKAGLTLNRAG